MNCLTGKIHNNSSDLIACDRAVKAYDKYGVYKSRVDYDRHGDYDKLGDNGGDIDYDKNHDNAGGWVKAAVNRIPDVIKTNAGLLMIAIMFGAAAILSLSCGIRIKSVMNMYSYDVLVILIIMELFTGLVAETGIMQIMAVKAAEISGGRKRACMVMFGIMMFLISSMLNNITAVMMILPVIFVLLESLEADKKYVWLFFSVILAISNTGGAASPIGDLPAVKIISSAITSFLSYLTHAFPLFALTTAVLLTVWSLTVKKETDDGGLRALAVANLKSQYENIEVRYDVLKLLAVVFAGMFAAWSFVPQLVVPPEMIAVLGYCAAMAVCALKKVKVKHNIDLKSVLMIASFLFFAEVVSQTGVLELIAGYLQANIDNPKLLVLAVMLITSVVAGIFSAGPAAAAMLPIITEICNGPLSNQSDWIAVAYAAAICAGSSLFMWSATAGLILSGKVTDAGITEDDGSRIKWGIANYFKYGIVNYIIQISIAMGAMALIIE